MADFFVTTSCFVLAMVAIGLIRILRGPAKEDRMMAAQLLGTGGVAALLLWAMAAKVPAMVDVALVLALLAVFASAAFVVSGAGPSAGEPEAAKCT